MKHQTRDSQIADYMDLVFDTFLELHGDRKSGDDGTVTGGLARLDSYKVVAIGYQNSRSVKMLKATTPAGYRKCSRLLRLAEAFNKPVVVFIDVLAVLSLPALEQQRINEAIARTLEEMSCLMTPIIGVIVGKSSGIAAIDMCAADRVLMLEGASCSVSLSNETSASDVNTEPLCLKAQDLLKLDAVHRTVNESSRDDLESTANMLREVILEELQQLTQIRPEDLVRQRLHRLQYQFLGFGASKLTSGNSENTI